MEKYYYNIAKCLKINMEEWLEKLVLEYKKDAPDLRENLLLK